MRGRRGLWPLVELYAEPMAELVLERQTAALRANVSEDSTHWIGLVAAGTPRAKASPQGGALAVVDVHGRLSTLATVRVPYTRPIAEGFETLSMLLDGDWEGLRSASSWRPLVSLDRFSPASSNSERASHPKRVFTFGLLLVFLEARGTPYVPLPRKLWGDAALTGVRHPVRGETREAARLKAAGERGDRFDGGTRGGSAPLRGRATRRRKAPAVPFVRGRRLMDAEVRMPERESRRAMDHVIRQQIPFASSLALNNSIKDAMGQSSGQPPATSRSGTWGS